MMVTVPLGLQEFTAKDVERVFEPIDRQLDLLLERGIDIVQQAGVPHCHSRRQVLVPINRLLPGAHNYRGCVTTSMTAGWPLRTISMARSSVGPS
jgi:hypothetical protein